MSKTKYSFKDLTDLKELVTEFSEDISSKHSTDFSLLIYSIQLKKEIDQVLHGSFLLEQSMDLSSRDTETIPEKQVRYILYNCLNSCLEYTIDATSKKDQSWLLITLINDRFKETIEGHYEDLPIYLYQVPEKVFVKWRLKIGK